MSTPRHLLAAAVATLVVMTGCGQDDTATAPPRHPAAAAPTASAGTGPVPVNCVATWTQGTTGPLTCQAPGPDKGKVKISADTLQLDRICVSDERLTAYGFGGDQTATIAATGTPPQRCADLGGVKRLPEKCICVPPAGGDCANPTGGKFICLIVGHVG